MSVLLAALAIAAPAAGAAAPAEFTFRTVRVSSPGNRSVSVVPFSDAIYPSCSAAPASPVGCLSVGSVSHSYGIGELEVTVAQWVAFLNTVDPSGSDPHHLYDSSESSSSWPRYGQIDFSSSAASGRHYAVAYPQWATKSYGFATFLRAARFIGGACTVASRIRPPTRCGSRRSASSRRTTPSSCTPTPGSASASDTPAEPTSSPG